MVISLLFVLHGPYPFIFLALTRTMYAVEADKPVIQAVVRDVVAEKVSTFSRETPDEDMVGTRGENEASVKEGKLTSANGSTKEELAIMDEDEEEEEEDEEELDPIKGPLST